jgi:uncharacterized protein YjbJ (UPF0337 family)
MPLSVWRAARHGYVVAMANYDDLKGRAKEAAGDLTDDEELQREGKVDQAQGTIKEKVENLGDRVKDAIRRD